MTYLVRRNILADNYFLKVVKIIIALKKSDLGVVPPKSGAFLLHYLYTLEEISTSQIPCPLLYVMKVFKQKSFKLSSDLTIFWF